MRFAVIEGLDGSGKSTQLKLLKDFLDAQSIPYKFLHFPRLEEGYYGKLIARFLRGEMGPNQQVDPYLVALIFAGDRADAAHIIRGWLEEGYLVIADRYVYSNIAFQCAKLTESSEQISLMNWIPEFEFEYHRIPRPDINLYLHVPFEFTKRQLTGARNGEDRDYLKGERDIHEESLDFQERVRHLYHALQGKVEDLFMVECAGQDGNMLSPEVISEKIIAQIIQKA